MIEHDFTLRALVAATNSHRDSVITGIPVYSARVYQNKFARTENFFRPTCKTIAQGLKSYFADS